MTQLLAFLTGVFAVYVLYEVFKTVSQPSSDSQTHFAPPPAPEPPVASAEAEVAEPAAESPVAESAAPAAHEEEKVITLRNPASGETCPVPSNYRFARKWVKEALVAEGLLPKVYKNSELTEAVNPKVKEALEKFKHLEKYHA